jgi:penicillin-binding protein 1A
VDALFVGYSGSVVAGSWIGFDANTTLGYGETGGKTALPVWMEYMQSAVAKYGAPDFITPDGITNILVNKETGKPLRSGESGGFMESFAEGMDPSSSTGYLEPQDESGEAGSEKPKSIDDDDYFTNQ